MERHIDYFEQSQNASVASEVAVEVTAQPEQLTSADVSTSISIIVDILAEEALNNSKVHRYRETIISISWMLFLIRQM